MVILGESPLPESLMPEINSPSAQFLSLSLSLQPSFSVNDFFDCPDDFALLALELLPSKLWQKARIVTFLKVLTWLDCDWALACELLELCPFGLLLWLELELFDEDD